MATNSKIQIWNKALGKIGETDLVESEDEDRPASRPCKLNYDDIVREVLEARHWPFAIRQRALTKIDTQTDLYTSTGVETAFDVTAPFLDPAQLTVTKIAVGGAETVLTIVTNYTLTMAADGSPANVAPVVALTSGQQLRIEVETTRVGWEHLYSLPADCVTPIGLVYGDKRYSLSNPTARLEHAIVPNDGGDSLLLCCDVDDDEFDALEYVAMIAYVAIWPAHFIEAVACRLARELALSIRKDRTLAKEMWDDYMLALGMASAYAQNVGHEITEPMTPTLEARG